MTDLTLREARRLALVRAGLLKPEWTGMPRRASGQGQRARRAAHAVIRRFGYLQLDTISIAGARSHTITLMSRLSGFDPSMGEAILQPGEPLFEYWGHEASWLPVELYPTFEFRRREFHHHPWWGDVLGENRALARRLLKRVRDEGPLRTADFEGSCSAEMWATKVAKKIALTFWMRGDLAIRERRNFQRVFDLTERVIPAELRQEKIKRPEALRTLLLYALAGHGWAQTGTLAATWRLRNLRPQIGKALEELREAGEIVPCAVQSDGKTLGGWIRPADLELAGRLRRLRPRQDAGVLLSPFDPVLWDRPRVERLFGFHQVLEIYKPAPQRIYGYYCLPVLAGERLVARVDLKAERKAGRLHVLSKRFEMDRPSAADRAAARSALERYAASLELKLS